MNNIRHKIKKQINKFLIGKYEIFSYHLIGDYTTELYEEVDNFVYAFMKVMLDELDSSSLILHDKINQQIKHVSD